MSNRQEKICAPPKPEKHPKTWLAVRADSPIGTPERHARCPQCGASTLWTDLYGYFAHPRRAPERQMRRLKVYGWLGWRPDCPPAPNGNTQVRYIVAATSWRAAVATIPGEPLAHAMQFGSVTANDGEVRQAMSQPGQAFWAPVDETYKTVIHWRRAE